MLLTLLLVSDLHYGGTGDRPVYTLTDKMIQYLDNRGDNLVIVAGDLTDHGNDGIITNRWCFPFLTSNSILTGGGEIDELGLFQTEFLNKLERISDTRVALVHGNHDTYNGARRYPVLDFIKKKYGNTYYYFQMHGIYFFMCGLYPDKEILEWLSTMFQLLKITKDTPLVFCFHYNLFGPFSEWWSEDEKNNFCNLIHDKRVLGILTGHIHSSYESNYKGIKVLSGAGNSFIKIEIEEDFSLKTTFIRKL